MGSPQAAVRSVPSSRGYTPAILTALRQPPAATWTGYPGPCRRSAPLASSSRLPLGPGYARRFPNPSYQRCKVYIGNLRSARLHSDHELPVRDEEEKQPYSAGRPRCRRIALRHVYGVGRTGWAVGGGYCLHLNLLAAPRWCRQLSWQRLAVNCAVLWFVARDKRKNSWLLEEHKKGKWPVQAGTRSTYWCYIVPAFEWRPLGTLVHGRIRRGKTGGKDGDN
ncbi:hypothetical protein BV20DRAFT_99714 [Pilatotrama ljubarskyi]|nr:hypothetical protein BV20DRAFT_99714 [Pilatotrama ljubarskyi]